MNNQTTYRRQRPDGQWESVSDRRVAEQRRKSNPILGMYAMESDDLPAKYKHFFQSRYNQRRVQERFDGSERRKNPEDRRGHR